MRRLRMIVALGLVTYVLGLSGAAAQERLAGDWTGEMRVGNETISINVQFARGVEGNTGTAEMSGQKDLALRSVGLRSNWVHFELPRDTGSFIFDGQLKGVAISGEVRRGNERGAFDLVRVIRVDAKIYDQYVGTYELAPNHVIGISQSPSFGLTFLDFKTGAVRRLSPLSELSFSAGSALFVPVPVEVVVTFVKGDRGEVSGLRWQPAGSPAKLARRLHFRHEEVTFSNGDVTLSGTLVLPNTEGPFPAYVRTHGSGKALRNIPSSEWTAYYGIACLTYDKRGSGKSTGDVQRADISDLADDALAGVQLLKSRADIDATQIGMTGASEGGWVVPLAASRSKDVSFIFIGSGSALSLGETIVYEVGMVGRQEGFSDEEIDQMKAVRGLYNDAILTNTGWDVLRKAIEESKDKKWLRYARVPSSIPATIPEGQVEKVRRQLDFDPEPVWEKITIPVQAIWGDLDRNVPARQSAVRLEQYLARAGNKDHTLIVFRNGNHEGFEAETGFDEEYPRLKRYVPGYNDAMINWLLKHVRVSSSPLPKPRTPSGATGASPSKIRRR
jgi:pimeloyl-ACP methyl ester carboxylesterase